MKQRRICWPNPDATCVEGGCLACNDHEFMSISEIQGYCRTNLTLRNRCGGESQPAMQAFWWGYNSRWPNVDTR